MKPAIILACAVALLILTPIYGENGERALDFLLLGDVSGWPNHLGDDEPAVDLTLVPCRAFGQDISDEFLFRWSRIYFPRGKSQLLEYDVLFLARPRLNFFTINQQEMMVDFIGTGGRVSIASP